MEAAGLEEWMKLAGATGIGTMLLAVFSRMIFGKLVEQGASNAIIANLREELERLSAMNKTLSDGFARLQSELLEFQQKNAELAAEVHRLKVNINGAK